MLFLFCPKNKCLILIEKIVCLLLRSQFKNIVGSVAKSLLPFSEFTTMKSQPTYIILSLEAKNAKKRTYIQLSYLDMIPIELLKLINLGTRGRHVFGAVL